MTDKDHEVRPAALLHSLHSIARWAASGLFVLCLASYADSPKPPVSSVAAESGRPSPATTAHGSGLAGPASTSAPAAGHIRWRSGGTAAPGGKSQRDIAAALVTAAFEHAAPTRRSGGHVVVQLSAGAGPAGRSALKSAGITFLKYLGDRAYFAYVSAETLDPAAVTASGLLADVRAIRPEWKMHPRLMDKPAPDWAVADKPLQKDAAESNAPGLDAALASVEMRVYLYVVFHPDVPLRTVGVHAIKRCGAKVVSFVDSLNAMVIELPRTALPLLAGEDAVQWMEYPLPPLGEVNDSVRALMGADEAQAPPYGLDGSGVTVVQYDGGTVDTTHPDFGGRVFVRDGSRPSPSPHATHVCGIISGDGASSGGLYRGVAPGATVQSYGFEYDGSGVFLFTNPGDIETDYRQAINLYGATVANNSIGTNTAANSFPCDWEGDYGLMSAVIDGIVAGSLGSPFRIVWAGGNERYYETCGATYHTLAPPASNKNAIVVGAVNSNDDSITYFTGWGPTDDGRTKPDIVAPGCQSDDDMGVTSTSAGGGYIRACGTSMAAPAVTGMCALLLQDFRAQFPGRPDPLNSTLKTLLAHNAVDLEQPGPDYQSGYGSVRIVPTIDFMRTGRFLEDRLDHLETRAYLVEVGPSDTQLRVTLAWDDPPPALNVLDTLVSDLDLRVYDPSSVQYFPWTLDPENPEAPAERTQPDRRNNMEQALVESPRPGVWRIEVHGYNLPVGPQTYSLCASPRLAPDCNQNGIADACDVDCGDLGGPCGVPGCGLSADCSGNGIPDECEPDCNGNGVADSCDIFSGTSQDCTGNGVPDECESDCNVNGVADSCDILLGNSADCDDNRVPDDCQTDCNGDGTPDVCELPPLGAAPDCNENAVPDGCDVASGTSADCNLNEIPDECDIASGAAGDCNANGIPDVCEQGDCNGDGRPDECEPDCNHNGFPDVCDIAAGLSDDCDDNGVPDECHGVFPAALTPATFGSRTGFSINAANPATSYSFNVASAGDFNDDGIGDMIIGETRRSYVVFGGIGIGRNAPIELAGIDGTNGLVINGYDRDGDSLHTVAYAGDLNGDGVSDAAIGNYAAQGNTNQQIGAVYVVFGGYGVGLSQAGGALHVSELDGANGFTVMGEGASQNFGWSVASAGDLNDDGKDDLIIGAPAASPGGRISAGKAYVIFGRSANDPFPAAFPLSSLDGRNGFVIEGAAATDFAGYSVSTAGDVNRDGVDDLILGAFFATANNKIEAGRCFVLFGHAKSQPWTAAFDLSTIDGTNGFAINGADFFHYAGWSVGRAGDVNGDAVGDMVIGARGAYGNTGESYIVFGHEPPWPAQLNLSALLPENGGNGGLGFAMRGTNLGDSSGWRVGSAGDLNNDGVNDVVVSALQAMVGNHAQAGRAYVVFGGPGAGIGGLIPLDSVNGIIGFAIDGTRTSEFLGWGVSAARDVNVDDAPDLIIGAQAKAYVIFGGQNRDCDGNGAPDACDVAAGVADDCDGNGVPDECQRDCNGDGLPDDCDVPPLGRAPDCNRNRIPDACELADGSAVDCDLNGVPDECEADCNANGVADACDISGGTSPDCNADLVPDECEPDCNGNGVADECDVAGGASTDCDANSVPDECQSDCDGDGIADVCELPPFGDATDCDANGIPDDCQPDCDFNGLPDVCELPPYGDSPDCNHDGVPDACELADNDCDGDGVPDDCQDCNGNGVADGCDLDSGFSADRNCNGHPDECDGYGWTAVFGGISGDFTTDIALDARGNIVVVGYFADTVDFDPSAGVDEHTAAGGRDIFVMRLHAGGGYAWARTFGGLQFDQAGAVAVDPEGNIVVVGRFNDVMDFDPGPGIDQRTAAGYSDVFVSKFTSAGDYVWTRTFGGPDWEEGFDVAINAMSEIYVTGWFYGTPDFDPSGNVDPHTSNGDYDIFVTKLYPDGAYAWTRTVGGPLRDSPSSLLIAGNGDVVMTGGFRGAVDFNPNPIGVDLRESNGDIDVFVTRWTANGGYLSTHTFGGEEWDVGGSLAVDPDGGLWISGTFSLTVDFDPEGRGDPQTAHALTDAFVTRLLANGAYDRTFVLGGEGYDAGGRLLLDSDGHITLLGRFEESMDFDLGPMEDIRASNGEYDIFATNFAPDGAYGLSQWTYTLGGAEDDFSGGAAMDPSGHLLIIGRFAGMADFDPTSGSDVRLSNGVDDLFITSLAVNDIYFTDCNANGFPDSCDLALSESADCDGNGAPDECQSDCDGDGVPDVCELQPLGAVGDCNANGIPDNCEDCNGNGLADECDLISGDSPDFDCNGVPDECDIGGWTAAFGGVDQDLAYDAVIAPDGGVIVTGYFSRDVDFDTGGGEARRTSQGRRDVFVTKRNADGLHLWTYAVGGPDQEQGHAVAIGPDGSIVVVGAYQSAMDFDPGPGEDVQPSEGDFDIFVAKLLGDGSYLWTRTMGGRLPDAAYDVGIDADGNVFVAGWFSDTVDFIRGPGIDVRQSIGNHDVFVTKFDADGTYQWTRALGGTAGDDALALAVDHRGNVLIAGSFRETVDFNPSSGQDLRVSRGEKDIFLTRFGNDGTYQWTRAWGGPSDDSAFDVVVDRDDNIYLTGYFADQVDFDAGAPVENHQAVGDADAFVLKLGPEGGHAWARTFGGPEADYGRAVALDHAGGVLVTGHFSATADFDFGAGEDIRVSQGFYDVFISRISASGMYDRTRAFGGANIDCGLGIAVDIFDRIVLAGYYAESVEFPFGDGSVEHSSHGNIDAFVTRLPLNQLVYIDCNSNGLPDGCDLLYDAASDKNGNGVLDECECGWTFLQSARSVALHDTDAGPRELYIDLSLGATTIEPRIGGFRIVDVEYARNLLDIQTSVTDSGGAPVAPPPTVAMLPGAAGPTSRVRLEFPEPLPNAARFVVTLAGTDALGCDVPPAELCIANLAGDVAGDGRVDAADLGALAGFVFQPVSPVNVRFDVFPGGGSTINQQDLIALRTHIGSNLAGKSCP